MNYLSIDITKLYWFGIFRDGKFLLVEEAVKPMKKTTDLRKKTDNLSQLRLKESTIIKVCVYIIKTLYTCILLSNIFKDLGFVKT